MAKYTLNWNQAKLTARVRAEAERRLRMVGQETVAELKRELSGPSPSPPGTPPGEASGQLVRSIRGRVTHPSAARFRLIILGARHGRILDALKKTSRRRPFVRGALAFALANAKRWFGLR